MTMITRAVTAMALAGALGSAAAAAPAPDLAALSRIPAVSGYEQALSAAIARDLAGLHPNTDNLADVWVTVGSGSPHRLIVAAIDQPGYVVSAVTAQGFLRVQRLPQKPPNAVFDTMSFAQPVWVHTAGGALDGAFAGLSIHLAPRRLEPPGMTHIDELYLDIGARSAAQARAAGADLLDPVTLAQPPVTVGADDEAGAGAGDRFGWEALLEVARNLERSRVSGTTTIAFVTQQWLGGRGLVRLSTELPADEMIFVGRITPQTSAGATAGATATPEPGEGVLIGVPGGAQGSRDGLPAALQSMASARHIPARVLSAAPPVMAGYSKAPELPHRLAELGVPTLLPVTPAETFSRGDLRKLTRLLEAYLEEPAQRMSAADDPFDAARPSAAPGPVAAGEQPAGSDARGDVGNGAQGAMLDGEQVGPTLQALTLAYGASGHEQGEREAVLGQLPAWARRLTKTDPAGNLVLSLGRGGHGPALVFDAHMDEIGYEVTGIGTDGRLQVKELGGFFGRYYLGHVMLVHTSGGRTVGGVLELPEGWQRPDFKWPPALSTLKQPAYVYVGTHSEAETEKLGIRVGDYLTIPKTYRPLLGSLVAVRSLDDRVGDTALVEGVRALGPDFAREHPGRRVTFVWTTGEEVGLDGAKAYAASAAKQGRNADVVFAIDTFVSSDSPLETQRFADAVPGQGFVVRAVDDSNIDPPADVARVIRMARDHNIPVQYGATGGGNDGAAYTRYGTVDVALGWPMIYSHSPVETASTNDVAALSRMVVVLATGW
ncbi:MAG: M20/M25/M40 family metallo-hydrolase [Gammaproteobacteria bacterium]|nr:M20/M25/M40 family metallo-hydrolase [Gammaproteobacteria bacterium]